MPELVPGEPLTAAVLLMTVQTGPRKEADALSRLLTLKLERESSQLPVQPRTKEAQSRRMLDPWASVVRPPHKRGEPGSLRDVLVGPPE